MLLVVGEMIAAFMRPERDVPLDRTAVIVGPFPSGAPAIFASAAARLGALTEMCAVVGGDPFGEMMIERLRRHGVGVGGIRIDPTATTATAFIAYQQNGERSFVFHVADAAAGRMRPEDLGDLPNRARWLHVSGSAIALGANLADTAMEAVRRARSVGARVSIDPNIRVEATSPEIRDRIRWMIGQGDVVFPSGNELESLGMDERHLAARGVIVCTTQGAEGAWLRMGDDVVHISAPPVREVDPDGAGDIFAAGFVAATLAGARPFEAAMVGCDVAAHSVEVFGPMESEIKPSIIPSVLGWKGDV
ncbi:MAG: sugar kinase [Chloroflexota bacterium]